jgi:hypothetical protein
MLVSLLGYFSLMITTFTAVVALLIGFSNNNSSFEKALSSTYNRSDSNGGRSRTLTLTDSEGCIASKERLPRRFRSKSGCQRKLATQAQGARPSAQQQPRLEPLCLSKRSETFLYPLTRRGALPVCGTSA